SLFLCPRKLTQSLQLLELNVRSAQIKIEYIFADSIGRKFVEYCYKRVVAGNIKIFKFFFQYCQFAFKLENILPGYHLKILLKLVQVCLQGGRGCRLHNYSVPSVPL